MNPDEITAELSKPISAQLLSSNNPARLSYTGLDGGPRVIPIAFLYEGGQILMWTVPHSQKVKSLRADPRAAITVDTTGQWPPRVLLVRGTVELTEEEGAPQGYLDASEKVTPASEFEAWKAGVQGLYQRMTRIAITPTWAKLLDFETTIPQAVEDLITGKS